ncbi:MAG: hypothetical protein V3S18_08245 [Dehalococcoidia bacterium]
MPDLEKIGEDLNTANGKASAALISYNTWMAGKAGTVTLTAGQKNTLKSEFTADITAVWDAAQRVLDELAA